MDQHEIIVSWSRINISESLVLILVLGIVADNIFHIRSAFVHQDCAVFDVSQPILAYEVD